MLYFCHCHEKGFLLMFQSKIPRFISNANRILLISVVFFYAFSLPAYGMGHRKKKSKDITVQGNVSQKKSDKNIVNLSGALVELLNSAKSTVASNGSDNSGAYQIKKKLSSGSYYIRCSAKEFKTQEIFCDLKQGKSYPFNFILEPEIDTVPPQITEVNPKTNSTFYENKKVIISPIVKDIDPSPLEYRFSIDGVLKQPWSSDLNYKWIANIGQHKIKVEARDKGGADSKEIEVYVYREPVEKP